MTRLAIVLACLATAQVFRSQTDAVSISASVKRANAPVANLTADDFRLTDNGVTQTIQLLTVESVPIDVTLFIDNSGSTSAVQDGMRRDTASIAAMLRPEDRLRVLTIGLAVDESVPWQDAGAPVTLQFRVVPGISLIYDALFAALTHRPAPGRRHLVVGLTDGEDCGSVVDGAMLLAASGRTEAVLHIIYASGGGNFSRNGAAAWCTPIDPESVDYVTRTADRTGGGMHMALFGNPTVSEFRKILDDFRASYVLRYSPRGVPRAGWHSVAVVVPAMPDVKIRARSGYFVDK